MLILFISKLLRLFTKYNTTPDRYTDSANVTLLKLPATSCWESPTVKENFISYSLANPAASNGECARCSVPKRNLKEKCRVSGMVTLGSCLRELSMQQLTVTRAYTIYARAYFRMVIAMIPSPL